MERKEPAFDWKTRFEGWRMIYQANGWWVVQLYKQSNWPVAMIQLRKEITAPTWIMPKMTTRRNIWTLLANNN